MLAYYERELIRELRCDGTRCPRCNALMHAPDLAMRSDGLCAACAEGKTLQ
jgi:hypothetical protein